MRRRIALLYAGLIAANAAAWAAALLVLGAHPALLGSAFLAYGFGLRHAVDADHIAAIDNVTRKLMQEGRRPIGVGFYFSLGHSTIVVLASVAIAATASAFKDQLAVLAGIGGVLGTLISAGFLIVIAAINLVILRAVWLSWRRVKAGGAYEAEDVDRLIAGGGLLNRLLRPLFALVRRDWHIYILGFLFGLGFDTATEVGLLGMSATQAVDGLPTWSILVFPALFTAGMSLADTTEGLLMLGAYGWAFTTPTRKLAYNMAVTSLSVLVALLVGAVEVLGLAQDSLDLQGGFWRGIGTLAGQLGTAGMLIVGLFLLC